MMNIITDLKYLRQQSCLAIGESVILKVIKDLEDNLDTKKGIGLSAIQIGIPKKVSIIRYNDFKLDLINAKLLDKYDKFRFQNEGCLSLPGIHVDTIRYKEIVIENNGKQMQFDINTDGLLPIIILHELNHQNGKLIIDKGIKWQKRR